MYTVMLGGFTANERQRVQPAAACLDSGHDQAQSYQAKLDRPGRLPPYSLQQGRDSQLSHNRASCLAQGFSLSFRTMPSKDSAQRFHFKDLKS